MLYVLAWRGPFSFYSHSDDRCRRIVSLSATDTFSVNEKDRFQVIQRPDLNAGDLRPYDSLNADDLTGPLLDLDPIDAPRRWQAGSKTFVAWTQNEMDARA